MASVIRMPKSGQSEEISERYDRGYRVAASNISFGEFMKAAAVLAAAVVTVGTIAFSERSPDALLIGLFLAISAGLGLYALAAILCAQGHMLRAALDTAANSSPLLSSAAKAKAMSATRVD